MGKTRDFSCHVDANGIDFGDDKKPRSHLLIFFAFASAGLTASSQPCKRCHRANAALRIRPRNGVVGVGTDGAGVHAGWPNAGDDAGRQIAGQERRSG